MKLYRTVSFVIFVALCIAIIPGRVSFAAPGADPDAKGSVGITAIGTDGTSITGSGTRTVVAGWTLGDVYFYASKDTGGRLYNVKATIDPNDQSKWSATLPNMPNATYTAYSFQLAVKIENGKQTDSQIVGSPLQTVVMNAQNNPNTERSGGTIAFGQNQPARTNGAQRCRVRARIPSRPTINWWRMNPA